MFVLNKGSSLAGRLGLTALLSGLMLSCSSLNPFGWAQSAVTIAELSQPTEERRVVEIQGKVINVAPFLTGGAYQIQDDTGTIWVRTNSPLPQKGAVVTLKGELTSEAIFIGAEKLAESYLLEIDPARASQDRGQITKGAGEISTSTPAVAPSPVQTPAPEVSPSSKPQAPLVNPNVVAPKPSPTPNPQPPTPIAVDPPPSAPPNQPPAEPLPSKPKPALNLDGEFLPHKQLDKP